MKSFAVLALVGAVVANPLAVPAGVTSAIAPKASAPAGCSANYPGVFEISVVNVTSHSKRSVEKRQDTPLMVTLANGILTDAKGRTGYIASNYQFQFDAPAQAGAIYTAGWSACANSSLALGGSAIFYQCLSGTFYNLYDQSTGAQCSPVYIDIVSISGSVSSAADGQITAASASGVATVKSDGQITASAVSSKVTSIACQYSDGQPQLAGCSATIAPITQISDGQIQAPTSTSSKAVVTQITDGQIQAPTSTSSKPVVTQITDGQIQAPTNATAKATATTAKPVAFTGAAALPTMRAEIFGLAAGILALAAL